MSILQKVGDAVSVLLGWKKPKQSQATDGWQEKSTRRFDLLIDTESDDGGHFTFNPKKFSLHATTDNGQKHKPLYNGLEAITEWETLRRYSGLEKTVELRSPEFDIEKISYTEAPKPSKQEIIPLFSFSKPKKESVFDVMMREGRFAKSPEPKKPEESIFEATLMFGKVFNQPDYGESKPFESKLPLPMPLGGEPDSKSPYLASKALADFWADEAYKTGAMSIREQIESLGVQDSDILKNMVPKMTKMESLIRLPGMLPSLSGSVRTYSPGEMLDMRGLPNNLR